EFFNLQVKNLNLQLIELSFFVLTVSQFISRNYDFVVSKIKLVNFSGKALWSIICGQSVLPSDEVVGEELENAADHLKEGILFYKQWSEDDHKLWCSKTKLKKEQQDFVHKVGNILDVSSEHAWEIFQLFLQYEYRGSASQLQSNPLHLLSCRRHILAADTTHPYEKLFKQYIHKVLDVDNSLGTKLIDQLRNMTSKLLPKPKSLSPHLPPNATQARISYFLSAIKHQLATLLVYYGTPGKSCPPEVCGLGRDLLENVGQNEKSLFHTQLEAIDAFHCFLLTLSINADSDPKNNPLCTPEWVSRLNSMIHSLGSKPWHYPPVLAWAILQGRRIASDPSCSAEEASRYSRLVQRAVKGNVFGYLQSSLKLTAFQTDQLLMVIGASITYSLVCIVGTCIDLEKIGLMPQVHQLAQVCLSYDPTSHFFWSEGGSEASVLLPTALEAFPHSPAALLDILTSLATANRQSAGKVVELLKELETFTWPLIMPECISIVGSQCVTLSDLQVLPMFVVPSDTHGSVLNIEAVPSAISPRLVCWQMSYNGWNVLLSSFQFLLEQIDSGGAMDSWTVDIVVRGLRLLSSILKSDIEHTYLFQEHKTVAKFLFISVAHIQKPDYNLTSALLEFFAEQARINCSDLMNDLEGCALLPFLPKIRTAGKKCALSELLVNYRAGNIRALICGVEASSGNFSVLMHLCSLIEIAVKNAMSTGSIRGIVYFVVKEVVPVMLLWRCNNITTKIELFETVFSLLHHVLEEGCVDEDLQELVVIELSNAKGGAGSTLKSILESSANLQATLDQPAEWPHSSHARKLTKLAKLALSLAHRLVGQFLTSGERLREFFLEGASNSRSSVTGINHRSWVALKPPHLALTIAHFVYHRLNPRLPYLALRTLTRLAKEMGVPLVACLGTEAEGLRDCLLTRLDSSTEDLWVKVAILRLLTIATPLQPGLIRLFLTPPSPLLDTLVNLLQQHKESRTEAGKELLLALVELVSSLWDNNLVTATAYLRDKGEFWDALFYCLCNKEPGNGSDDIIGGIFKIYSVEFYSSCQDPKFFQDKSFMKNLKKFIDPESEKFKSWIKYIFGTFIENKVSSMDVVDPSADPSKPTKAEVANLVESCCQFFIIVLSKSPDLISREHKSLLNLFEVENGSCNSLQICLAEIHLTLLDHCGKILVDNPTYTSYLSQLLGTLRSSVIQTRSSSQVMILAAILKAVSSLASNTVAVQELSLGLVKSSVLLVEQHCALASSSADDGELLRNPNFEFSSSGCLAIACNLLYRCLETLSEDKILTILGSSHLVYALLQAAMKHTETGNTLVVREILHLLSLIARRTSFITSDLTTHNLAVTVSLVLESHKQVDLPVLRDLLWCTTYCLKKEGASGLEGAVSLAAVHLSPITTALASPHTQADLALAAASLVATLVPYHQLWRVLHQDCFEQLISAAASCIHRSTKMLHLKETLEREVCGDKKQKESTIGEKCVPNSTSLSQETITLINKLLQILSACLETVRYLSPDVTELLCCPSSDKCFSFDFIQPSIRRQSGDQIVLPNLATLADVLDLFNTFIPKDGRYSSPLRNTSSSFAKVDLPLLTHCVEQSLLLFITYSALLIVSPSVQAREARDVRTFLADETSSFFNHWIGRRTVATGN
ncbi:Nucleoporin protein, partial [Armadillidium vulgare]